MEQGSKGSTGQDVIDTESREQVARWAREFGVDEQELRNAVKAVGPGVEDVREHLKLHFHRD